MDDDFLESLERTLKDNGVHDEVQRRRILFDVWDNLAGSALYIRVRSKIVAASLAAVGDCAHGK